MSLTEIRSLRAEVAKAHDRINAAHDIIAGMVNQHCTRRGEPCNAVVLDSMALTSNMHAMHFLADHGSIEITAEAGRRVIAKWKHEPDGI